MKHLLTLILLLTCWAGAQEVEPAAFYEELFRRDQGWTGADGTYSYRVDEDTTLWSFSDTFFGRVEDGAHRDFRFVNNSHVLQTGADLSFLEAPSFTPPDRKGWFWMWDGVLSAKRFEVLLGQFDTVPDGGALGFKQIGLWYGEASLGPDRLIRKRYRRLPFHGSRPGESITFGSAVMEHGAWLYIVGIHDRALERRAVLARAPRGRLGEPGVWRFHDGNGWGRDMWAAAPLFPRASMESSLFSTRDGGFLWVGSLDTQGDLVARHAPTPTGPWSDPVLIYQPPERAGDVYTYNAKAHPHLSGSGRLLISYNVNTLDLEQVIEDADIYRPRFIWWTPPRPGWMPASQP